ncbi:arylsulfatase A-like enzyme [Lewinella aquimaris]|uniref:Arylsulfatase A-like enzyme n=1 Tax=Neolewinella aquimaris TaxID=1835722 RepID=A0A840E4H2_9BACT|nr:arylsulfatase [Neolewinella aquimaris]MBB4080524.1 arylsulfatase A-like enzyme [Neolewinella aquimaris]
MKAILSFIACLLSLPSFAQLPEKLPNVVVVLADDIGYGDVAGYRRQAGLEVVVETPHLDRLMERGLSFTDAHSPTSLCAPSRYAVMTGNNPYRSYAPWGVWGSFQPSPIRETDITLGELMQRAGYQTAFLGKWHLGGDYYRRGDTTQIYRGDRSRIQLDVDISRIVGGGPLQQGFEYSLTFPAGIQDVPYAVYENHRWMPLTPDSRIGEITQAKMTPLNITLDKDEGLGDTAWNPYLMGPLLAGKAVDYIREAPSDRPLFLYYAALAVHLPHTPADSLNGERIRGTTPSAHLDLVKELDVQVGMLVDALEEKGIYDNTLFVFTSDNGGLRIADTEAAGHFSPGSLRGSKNQAYEGGHRVPLIATWPGEIPPGETSDVLVSGTDLLATLAALTHQPLADHQAMDSHDFLPVLLHQPDASRRDHLLLQSGTDRRVIYRDGNWKLIMHLAKDDSLSPVSLFDLADNPAEDQDRDLINAPDQQERITTMLTRYTAQRSSGF